MANTNTRIRAILIMEMLYKYTDDEHPATSGDIKDYLAEKGIVVNRKTLAEDLQAVLDMDYGIVMQRSSPNKYFWGNRTFELPELKLLVDAVSSSRFISDRKSRQLIKKLQILTCAPEAEFLENHITATGHTKADNTKLYYIVDTITDAIIHKKKIQFKYYDYNGKKEKVFKHDGYTYMLSPYELYWNEDYYYVVGYSDKHGDIASFRVDRLYKPEKLAEKAVAKPPYFKVRDYADKIFSMYGGEEAKVTLECDDEMMKYIIDKFGIDVDTEPTSKGTFMARVTVIPSPTFYGWVFGFGGKIRIIGPEDAIAKFKSFADKVL